MHNRSQICTAEPAAQVCQATDEGKWGKITEGSKKQIRRGHTIKFTGSSTPFCFSVGLQGDQIANWLSWLERPDALEAHLFAFSRPSWKPQPWMQPGQPQKPKAHSPEACLTAGFLLQPTFPRTTGSPVLWSFLGCQTPWDWLLKSCRHASCLALLEQPEDAEMYGTAANTTNSMWENCHSVANLQKFVSSSHHAR